MVGYQYKALPDDQSIRMLLLAPGEQADPLKGSLEVVDCNSAGNYESLSYVWGAPDWDHEILIQDKDGEGQIKLLPSLFGALVRLRRPDQTRRIWIDQICINQGDQKERGSQVKFMNRIYKQASHVLVWLGRDQYGMAQPAFDLVLKLSDTFKSNVESNQSQDDLIGSLEKIPKDQWEPLNHLTDLPWV